MHERPTHPATDRGAVDESINPWRVLSKAPMYENPWIRVDHHEVLNPSGYPGIYGLVHFKNHATAVVPVDERGNVILVGQYRFATSTYSWEIPEGGGKPGAALEAAQRELREETGVTAAHWTQILQMDLSNSVTDEHGTAFLAWGLTQSASQPEASEQLQVIRLPFWEAVACAQQGKIRDVMSIASLLRVALMSVQGQLPAPLADILRP